MSAPSHDLSRLRIDRGAPPEVRRAFGRNPLLAVLIVAGAAYYLRRGAVVPVQVVTATALTSGSGGTSRGTSVTANGYLVARTRGSVSAKVPGRRAHLGVSEGSYLRKADIIARLENADYEAQVIQADAIVMGLVGGFFPARRAATQPVVQALR